MISTLPGTKALRRLARYYGIVPEYRNMEGLLCGVSEDTLQHLFKAMGVPEWLSHDPQAALLERRSQLWQRGAAPACVVWEAEQLALTIRLPKALARESAWVEIWFERGPRRKSQLALGQFPTRRSVDLKGGPWVSKRIRLPGAWPLGYHRLTLRVESWCAQTHVICAPRRAFGSDPKRERQRGWGIFVPLYAFHSRRSWGSGDLTDLESLMKWAARLGARVVATLPLFASFLAGKKQFEFSPYAPASRLFWNELYLDVNRIPEWKHSGKTRRWVRSGKIPSQIKTLQAARLVDYRRTLRLKRQVLERLAASLLETPGPRRRAFQRYLNRHPDLERYARFRAGLEGKRDSDAVAYHAYVQWVFQEQLESVARQARRLGVRLCLDLPLGIHRDGYDVLREPGLFVLGMAAGAPPDSFFVRGQNWGFPPLNPERLRAQGYRYYREVIGQGLAFGGLLRLDHVMGLHRLYWIPHGLSAKEGAYVRYPAQELYALLCLESHRRRGWIAGEDLGIVPAAVREKMAEHGISNLYVLQYELPGSGGSVKLPEANALASLNTHDMPPFAAAWKEPSFRSHLARLPGAGGVKQVRQALWEALAFLGRSHARWVVVNLEDLWLETKAQNVPGSWRELPNWRRKARYSFEAFSKDPRVLEGLRLIAQSRHR